MRSASIKRESKETGITLTLTIDGKGDCIAQTPIPFLNHLLENLSKHGLLDLNVRGDGDLHVDQHHFVEDLGQILGKAFKEALGEKRGISRAGFFAFPMDETLGIVAIDFSGRPYSVFKATFARERIGDLESDSIREFFSGFAMGGGCNVAVYIPYGENDHHKVESIFKAFGKALWMACEIKENVKDQVPSTKGLLDKL